MSVEMKDSGIDWIGEIPKYWTIKSLKFIFKNLDYLREPISAEHRQRNNPIYDYYGASGVIDKIDFYNVDDTVLLIGEDGANLKMRNLPLIYKASGKFWVNNHTHILKPIKDNYNYLAHLLESADYTNYITGSAQPKLSQEKLSSIYLCIPPTIEEQSRIANFLDKKCAEIDELIALQEQMIAQLNTYKQAVITETVTKGLDPNVKMKDSGVEWIGEIPEHWGNAKIKNFIALVESGVSVNAGGNSAGENEYGVLKTSSVSKYVFDITENKTVFSEEIERLKCSVKANTLIVSRMNTPELVGACGYVEENSYNIFLPDRLWQVHLASQIHVKFVWYYLRSSFVRAYYSSLSSGTSSSMQNISQDQFANVSIMLPPLLEQQSIAQYLDQKCKEIDELISIKKEKIEHLKAYKKSVIYEYVTGKKHTN